MSSASLTETKAMLITALRHLRDAEARIGDARPSHTNEVDQWIAVGTQEAQELCNQLRDKIDALVAQI